MPMLLNAAFVLCAAAAGSPDPMRSPAFFWVWNDKLEIEFKTGGVKSLMEELKND